MNEKRKLAEVVNDGSRKVKIRGKQVIVPLKFDAEGNPATDGKIILKRLTLNDLRFLQSWRGNNWDLVKTRADLRIESQVAERLIKKLQCFRDEDAKVKALAEIPTPAWISAKHVENVYEGGGLEDSQHKSLAELAKITGSYKNTNQVNITQNVINFPQLSPEAQEAIKAIAEKEADAVDAEVVNG